MLILITYLIWQTNQWIQYAFKVFGFYSIKWEIYRAILSQIDRLTRQPPPPARQTENNKFLKILVFCSDLTLIAHQFFLNLALTYHTPNEFMRFPRLSPWKNLKKFVTLTWHTRGMVGWICGECLTCWRGWLAGEAIYLREKIRVKSLQNTKIFKNLLFSELLD